MNRPRDRLSAHGLLPRMETRPRKDGLITYRYHPLGGKPMNLGTDRVAAIRQVLDLLGEHDDAGSLQRLWAQYQQTPSWADLTPRTRADYTDHAEPLLRVFGPMRAADITAPMVARYLRVERGTAPVRANREIALLGNLISLAIERGEAEHNPCRGGQVKRNKERPRTNAPAEADLAALATFAAAKGGQWRIIVLAARFAALAGSRQAELLPLHWPQWNDADVRLRRAKQRGGAEKVERVEASPALQALRAELQALATNPTMGAVFPNRQGNPYTSSGFAAMWGKLMREATAKGIVARRFTFHDLRAYYVTEHKRTTGALPDTHASPTTTARVYERSREARRKAL
jgi:integrase